MEIYLETSKLAVPERQPSYGQNEDKFKFGATNIAQNLDEDDLDEDEFQPSSSRFIIAALIVVSSALNCFIQYSFVTIW